jgi:uncharacterized protein HemX
VSDPTGERRERARQIARNESERQTTGDIRVSVWAIAVALILGLTVLGWLLVQ